MTIYYNPITKVIFASDDAQTDPVYSILASQIDDLVPIGATVDASVTQNILQPGVDAGTDTAGLPGVQVPTIPDQG